MAKMGDKMRYLKSDFQYQLAVKLIDKMILPNMFDLAEAECKAIERVKNRRMPEMRNGRILILSRGVFNEPKKQRRTISVFHSIMRYPAGKLPGRIGNERRPPFPDMLHPDAETLAQWDEWERKARELFKAVE